MLPQLQEGLGFIPGHMPKFELGAPETRQSRQGIHPDNSCARKFFISSFVPLALFNLACYLN